MGIVDLVRFSRTKNSDRCTLREGWYFGILCWELGQRT